MTLRPLALLYSDAIDANNARERCLMLQQLGDMALFLGALFPQRFTRHGILQDYFIGMGGSAYDYLADPTGTLALGLPEDPGDERTLAMRGFAWMFHRWLADQYAQAGSGGALPGSGSPPGSL